MELDSLSGDDGSSRRLVIRDAASRLRVAEVIREAASRLPIIVKHDFTSDPISSRKPIKFRSCPSQAETKLYTAKTLPLPNYFYGQEKEEGRLEDEEIEVEIEEAEIVPVLPKTPPETPGAFF